jgi:hypothetical protein
MSALGRNFDGTWDTWKVWTTWEDSSNPDGLPEIVSSLKYFPDGGRL